MAQPTVLVPGAQCAHDLPGFDELPQIRVLGRVVVIAAGPVDHSHRHRLTELGAFLAFSRSDLDHHLVDEAIWPGQDVAMPTRNSQLSRLRRWWGTDRSGMPYVARNAYRVRCWSDWHELCRLTTYTGAGIVTLDDVPTAHLVDALRLVQGRPFAGTPPRRYRWAELLRANAEYLIDATAIELARRESGPLARFAFAVRAMAVPWAHQL